MLLRTIRNSLLVALAAAALASGCDCEGAPARVVAGDMIAAKASAYPTGKPAETTALVGEEITLDGTKTEWSVSHIKKRLTYQWTLDDAPEGAPAIVDATSETAKFTPDRAGELRFTLTVNGTDEQNLPRAPGKATAKITVHANAAASLVFTTQPGNITAGAAFSPDVQVTLVDAAGHAASETAGTISLTLQPEAASDASLLHDGEKLATATVAVADGVATFPGLSVDRVGHAYVLVAHLTGDATLEDLGSTRFDVTAGAPDKGHWSYTVDHASLHACDAEAALLTATVHDAFDNPVPDVDVAFEAPGTGHVLEHDTAKTDASGIATAKLTAAVPGVVATAAKLGDDEKALDVTFTPGAPNGTTSRFVAVPAEIVADGVATSLASLTLRDGCNNAIGLSDVVFALSGDPARNAIAPGSPWTTDAAGAAQVALASTEAGLKTVTATVGTTTLSAQVLFTAGAPDGSHSRLDASPTTLTADDASLSALTVLVADAHGNPVPGVDVTFTVDGSANTLSVAGVPVASPSEATVKTGPLGTARVDLASRKAERKKVTATFTGLSTPLTTFVTFVAGAPSAAQSRLVALPNRLVADGTTTSTLTATINDRFGNPVSGVALAFSATLDPNTFAPTGGTTDADGHVVVRLSSTKSGLKTATATFSQGAVSTDVTFDAGAAANAHSTFTASPDTLAADGTATTTLTATLKDAFDNPVTGTDVTFAYAGTGTTFVPANGVKSTDSSGIATVTLASTVAQAKAATATAAGGLSLSTNVTFTPGSPVAASSTFVATPSSGLLADDGRKADATDTSTLVLTLKDAKGNPVPGIAATFDLGTNDYVVNHLSARNGNTDANGKVTLTLTSRKAESKTVIARFGTSSDTLNAVVTFVAGAPDGVRSTLTTSKTSLASDGVATTTLTATIRDAFDNPVSGATVAFDATLPPNTFSPDASVPSTPANGVAARDLSSTQDGKKTVSALVAKGATTIALSVDVTFTETPATVSNITVPSPLTGCATISYVLKQDRSKDEDVEILFSRDATSVFEPATGHASMPDGVTGLATSPAGVTHVFVWNTSADFGHSRTTTVRLRITPIRNGVRGTPVDYTGTLTIDNGITFGSPVTLPVAPPSASNVPTSSAVADFNLDGRPDVAYMFQAPNANNVNVFLQNQAPSLGFTGASYSLQAGSTPYQMVAADVNLDGYPDLLLAHSTQNDVGLLLNNGGSGFTAYTFGTGANSQPRSLVVGDFNRDGRPDVAVGCYGTNTVVMLRNTGNAGSSLFALEQTINAGGLQPWGIVAGDLNGDGLLDVVTANSSAGSNSVSVLLGNGDFTLAAPRTFLTGAGTTGPRWPVLGDFNRDGKLDVVVSNFTAKTIGRLLGKGDGDLLPATAINVNLNQVTALHAADMDADGKLDLLASVAIPATTNPLRLGFLRGTGDSAGSFAAPVEVLPASQIPYDAFPADIDRDGRPDLTIGFTTNSFGYLLNTNPYRCDPGFTPPRPTVDVYPSGGASVLAKADVNNDGLADLLAAGSGQLSVFYGFPDGTFDGSATPYPLGTGFAAGAITTGDFNRDGWTDVAVTSASSSPKSALVLLNAKSKTNLATFTSAGTAFPTATGADDTPFAITAADFTRDGFLDLLVTRTAGALAFSSPTLLPGAPLGPGTFPNAYSGGANTSYGARPAPVVVDWNMDGWPDVVTSGQKVVIGTSTGLAPPYSSGNLFTPATAPGVAAGYFDADAGDLNRDGFPDVAFANNDTTTFGALRLLLNNRAGNGAFADVRPPNQTPAALAVLDVDGDGQADLLEPTTDGRLAMLLLDPAKTATTLPTTFFSCDNPTSDRPAGSCLKPITNPARGLAYFTAGTSPKDLVTGDFNADGLPDVAVLDTAGSGSVRVLLGH